MTNGWRTHKRETWLTEHICPHGIGHPCLNSAEHMKEKYSKGSDRNPWLVHGCDGCCNTKYFPCGDEC